MSNVKTQSDNAKVDLDAVVMKLKARRNVVQPENGYVLPPSVPMPADKWFHPVGCAPLVRLKFLSLFLFLNYAAVLSWRFWRA